VSSFARRAREEVERIKAEEAKERERKEARMQEFAREARERQEARVKEEERRIAERNAKLRHQQDERALGEERLAKASAKRSWQPRAGRRQPLRRRRGPRCGMRC